MKTLKETLEEFDEKFNFLYCMENVENDIKAFISQSIKTALESVAIKEKKIYAYDTTHSTCYKVGWNKCREQLLKNIENYLTT